MSEFPEKEPVSPVAPVSPPSDGVSLVGPITKLPAREAVRSLSPRTKALLGGAIGALVLAAIFVPLIVLEPSDSARRDNTPASGAAAAGEVIEASVAMPLLVDAGSPLAEVDAAPPKPPVWRVTALAADANIALIEGSIGKKPLSSALLAAGLSAKETHRLTKALEGTLKLDKLSPKDAFTLAKDKATGKVVAFELSTSPFDVFQAREEEGVLASKKLELRVEQKRVAVSVAVTEDLKNSLQQAGLHEQLLDVLDDALEGHVGLADLRPGARLRVVATEDRVEGAFARYADLAAVEYTPAPNVNANVNALALRVYHFAKADKKGVLGYYDAKAQKPYRGGWRSPVPFARVTSRFNPHRMHPVMHVVMPHNGVDFAASPGTPVYSAAGGTVQSVGDGGPCGNMVQVLHTNGLVTAYCHLSRFAAGLRAGQHVEARQLVGYVGQTGRATGPHLHFAVKRGEMFMDPLALKLDGVRVVPPGERDEFAKIRAELDLTLDGISLPAAAASADGGVPDDDAVFADTH